MVLGNRRQLSGAEQCETGLEGNIIGTLTVVCYCSTVVGRAEMSGQLFKYSQRTFIVAIRFSHTLLPSPVASRVRIQSLASSS